MNHSVTPASAPSTAAQASVPAAQVSARAAAYLIAHHGPQAMTEAVRHGMSAKRRGDDAAAEFWCSVCSTLVRMQQAETVPA